jgi:hypothetical protein
MTAICTFASLVAAQLLYDMHVGVVVGKLSAHVFCIPAIAALELRCRYLPRALL